MKPIRADDNRYERLNSRIMLIQEGRELISRYCNNCSDKSGCSITKKLKEALADSSHFSFWNYSFVSLQKKDFRNSSEESPPRIVACGNFRP